MASMRQRFAPGVTLALAMTLHAFTHAYGVLLVPLYLLIVADLHLSGVKAAGMIVTVYSFCYSIASYGAGVVADRVNRKTLLGFGLIANAAAVMMMAFTRDYSVVLALAVAGGLAGTIYHPAANALVPEHFPKSPGMAIGLLGIGSGFGFFLGPQYAGWRSETAHWTFAHVANWQRPCAELGLAGVVFGILFLLIASEARPKDGSAAHVLHPPLGPTLRWRMTAIGAVLGMRDFAGVASLTLSSIYLQKALGCDARQTGLILGLMMLMGVIASPLAVYLTPGARRLPALVVVLIAGGAAVASVPLWPARWALPVLCVFQGLQLGSYAISDAATLERVPAIKRGRVVGLFLTIAGTFSGLSPWVMGFWTDAMHGAAREQHSYLPPYATLGVMMGIAAFSVPIIARLGRSGESMVTPMEEIVPMTMEPAG